MKHAMFALALCAGTTIFQSHAADGVLVADTYVRASTPTNNFGALPSISVSSGSTALLQFNLATLPPGATAANIVKANLIIYAGNVAQGGAVDAAAVTAAWTENTVTSANAPAAAPIPGATALVGNSGQYLIFDVTATVRNWVNAPSSNFGFELLADASSPAVSVSFDSKENTTTSHPARLQIETADTGPAGPAGVQGQPGLPGPLGPQGPTGPIGVSALAPLFGLGTNQATAGTGAPCSIGEVILSAGARVNAIPANGQTLLIAQYQPLFSVIGWMYSPGQNSVTFNLPDLRAAAPNGLTYSICFNGVFPTRS